MQAKTEPRKLEFCSIGVTVLTTEPISRRCVDVAAECFEDRDRELLEESQALERDRDAWRLRAAALFFVAMVEAVFIVAGWR